MSRLLILLVSIITTSCLPKSSYGINKTLALSGGPNENNDNNNSNANENSAANSVNEISGGSVHSENNSVVAENNSVVAENNSVVANPLSSSDVSDTITDGSASYSSTSTSNSSTSNSSNSSASSTSQIKDSAKVKDATQYLPRSYVDIMIQDVCVDSNNKALPLDPINCEANGYKRRDLAYGENLPYHKHDLGKYQRSDSIPLLRADGTWMGVSSMEFGSSVNSKYAFGDFDEYDGFNTAETAGGYYSFTSTMDGNGGYQPFWNARGGNDDSWTIGKIGMNFNAPEEYTTTIDIAASFRNMTTPNSYTIWDFYPSFEFTRGKKFATYVSHHFSRPKSDMSNSDNASERFYFTPHYGLTRWESWTTYYHCRDNLAPLGYDCNGTGAAAKACSGDTTATMYGHPWVRVDCRDWAQVETNTVPTSPYALYLPEEMVGSYNQLKNATFANGSLSSWKRTSNIDWDISRQSGNNAALAISCSNCDSQSLYQIANVSDIARNTSAFRAGLKMWSKKSGAKAKLMVVQRGASGQELAKNEFDIILSTTEAQFEYTLTDTNKQTKQIDFYISPLEVNIEYSLDDPWVAARGSQKVPSSGNGGGYCGLSSGCGAETTSSSSSSTATGSSTGNVGTSNGSTAENKPKLSASEESQIHTKYSNISKLYNNMVDTYNACRSTGKLPNSWVSTVKNTWGEVVKLKTWYDNILNTRTLTSAQKNDIKELHRVNDATGRIASALLALERSSN